MADEQYLAEAAKRLLQDESFLILVADTGERYKRDITETAPQEHDKREDLYRRFTVLQDILTDIEMRITPEPHEDIND